MKNPGHSIGAALLLGAFAAPAWAAENEEAAASLTLQFSGLKWSQSTTQLDGDAPDREATSLNTSDLVDSMIWASLSKVNLYFYPFQDSSAAVSVGYMLRDDLELGIDLGWNASKVKDPKSENSSHLIGGFFTWIVPLDSCWFENIGILDFTRSETTEVDSASQEETTRTFSGSILKGSSSILVPLAKNAWYMAGVWVAAVNDKDHSSSSTEKTTQFGVTLAGLRLTFD